MSSYDFIVCNSRSGSTLTRNILAQWNDIAISPELEFLYRIASQRRKFLPLSDPGNQQALADRLFGKISKFDVVKNYRKLSNCTRSTEEILASSRERFTDYLATEGELTFPMIYRWVIGEFSIGDGNKYLIKKPSNLYMIPLIRDWFPEARILGLVRDPRDTVVSMTKGSRQHLDAFWKAPCLWSFNANRLLTFQRKLPDQQLMVQRFEDLIQHPEDSLKTICDFLELPYDPEKAKNPDQVNSSFEGSKRGFNTDVIARYAEKLIPTEIELIELFCQDEMKAFNYEVTRLQNGSADRWRQVVTSVKKQYMFTKENIRARSKNSGYHHWLAPLIGT